MTYDTKEVQRLSMIATMLILSPQSVTEEGREEVLAWLQYVCDRGMT